MLNKILQIQKKKEKQVLPQTTVSSTQAQRPTACREGGECVLQGAERGREAQRGAERGREAQGRSTRSQTHDRTRSEEQQAWPHWGAAWLAGNSHPRKRVLQKVSRRHRPMGRRCPSLGNTDAPGTCEPAQHRPQEGSQRENTWSCVRLLGCHGTRGTPSHTVPLRPFRNEASG